MTEDARWRADIESLVFPIGDQAAICAVHRGAFRTLLGTKPTPQACLAYFAEFEGAFRAAANLKIARKCIPAGTNSSSNQSRYRPNIARVEPNRTRRTTMTQSQVTHLPVAAGQVGRLAQSLMAMMLGLFIVGVVGFSNIDVVHNAAHDVRHSNAFPCH